MNNKEKESEEDKDFPFEIEPVLNYIGPKARWQYFQSFCLFLFGASAGMSVVSFAFPGYIPNYRCIIPICESINASYYSNITIINKITIDKSCQRIIPKDDFQTCEQYLEFLENNNNNFSEIMTEETCKKDELIFDYSIVTSSLVEDFSMTCSDKYQRDILNSIYMIGSAIGSSSIGIVSDKGGRIKAMVLSLLCMGLPGIISALWVNKPVYGIFRILAGMGYRGAIMIATVIASESVPSKYKVMFIFIPHIGFNVGEVIIAIESYFIRDWQMLQLLEYSPIFAFAFLCLVLPNPARWLLSKGWNQKARKVLQRKAKISGKGPIPDTIFIPITEYDHANKGTSLTFMESLKSIITNRTLLLRTFNVHYQWFSVIMVYTGTMYIGTKLYGNPHLNFFLSVIPSVPSNFLYLVLPDRLGRRNTLILCEVPIGILCIVISFIANDESLVLLQIILAMVVRLFVALAIKILFTLTAELFPTPVRSTTVGIGSMMGSIGGFFGFLIESLATLWNPLPLLIIGSLAIFGAILSFLLPETKNESLPETIEDAINLGEKKVQSEER